MNISNKAKYAIRIMMYLGLESGNTMTVQDVFIKEDVSKRYLEQIFSDLKRAGLVHSIKGKNGGYYITKSLNSISVYHIIRALEGEGSLGSLASSKDKDLECVVDERIWNPLKDKVEQLLSSITIEMLISDYNKRRSNMFYI